MQILDRFLPDFPHDQQGERRHLLGLMAMFFLVVTAVGILNPVRNALALSGLASGEFYKVYLVSAVVVLLVPVYNRLADRVGWRTLVPAVAVFFALNLVAFRLAYREGSALFGVTFYGWYDLFAAALVTQFFVATQMFITARTARSAYPLVIGGGAIGAMMGGGIAGFLADRIGTENLLLVGACFILAFAAGIRSVWPRDLEPERPARARVGEPARRVGEVRRVFSNPHVRLIAASVLLTVVAKQLVDYQFNTLTEQIFGGEDEIAAFQGKVTLATQWLPLVSVIALRPLLRRWGVGAVVFLLPGLMLLTSLGMAALFSIWSVIAVRTADRTFRYSAERAGREILYVPVPDAIKLKAKTYIDVGIEKGLGKALSAAFLALLVEVAGLTLHQIAWVVLALAVAWVGVTAAIRREYVRTLAHSIRGRFASFQGLAALSDASTVGVVRRAMRQDDPAQTSFLLDLIERGTEADVKPLADALHDLLDHESDGIRAKALVVLARTPGVINPTRVRPRLEDPSRAVRERAVLALVAASGKEGEPLVEELLRSERADIRTAVLTCIARGEIPPEATGGIRGTYLDERWERAQEGDRDARVELALAAGAMAGGDSARELLEPFLGDPDPLVASSAIRSAGLLRDPALYPAMTAGLKTAATRHAARDALAAQGAPVVELLGKYLLDETTHPALRRHIPSVLARIPSQESVRLMLHSVVAPETDQLLDFRTLKALSQLRTRAQSLEFEPEPVMLTIRRELDAASRYRAGRRWLHRRGPATPRARLLDRALQEAWEERREGVFRLLGLLHPAESMQRCLTAVAGDDRALRGNALEWLEETLDRPLFQELAPVLGEGRESQAPDEPGSTLTDLASDGDPWVAQLADAVATHAPEDWSAGDGGGIISSGARSGTRETRGAPPLAPTDPPAPVGTAPMDLIEKVFLLQKIDLLRDARSRHLALLASIAEEVDADPDTILIRRGEATDALYVVIDGRVRLSGEDQEMEAANGRAFGTWALIDEAPSVLTAEATERARLLRITRSDFHDLLADHPELALGLLQGLARRVRTLVA